MLTVVVEEPDDGIGLFRAIHYAVFKKTASRYPAV
jgi:hypothetical protein